MPEDVLVFGQRRERGGLSRGFENSIVSGSSDRSKSLPFSYLFCGSH